MTYLGRILTVTLTLACGIAIVIFAVAIPSVRGIVDLREKIEAERARLEIAAAKAAAYRTNATRLSEVTAELPRLEQVFLPTGGEVQFFTDLEKLARTNAVSATVEIREILASAEERVIPLDLKLTGTFLNFFRYLLGLEKLERLVAVQTLTMGAEAIKAGQENPLLNITLHAILYGEH